uniref:Small nuclear RNA activating complex polypeptide 5 n=1 Tax=Naja naja TaxID=35670 RepID=A0A8C6XMS6_NAJNA
MLSRLQELRKEEETLLRVKEALHDQLTRLKVEELALRSMINAREGTMFTPSAAVTEEHINVRLFPSAEVALLFRGHKEGVLFVRREKGSCAALGLMIYSHLGCKV